MTFRVTSPLVIVADRDGVLHHRYAGDVITWLDSATADRLVLDGMVVEVGGVELPPADPTPALAPTAAEPAVEAKGKPKRTAPKDVWVDYAVTQKILRPEAEAMSRQELIELFS